MPGLTLVMPPPTPTMTRAVRSANARDFWYRHTSCKLANVATQCIEYPSDNDESRTDEDRPLPAELGTQVIPNEGAKDCWKEQGGRDDTKNLAVWIAEVPEI